jgi:proline iminopeptidase
MSTINQIYPEIEPYNEGFLKVSDIHTIYYEECGNKDGIPALFLHG